MSLYKNKAAQKLAVYAHDKTADVPKTGDAGNITAAISKDGGTLVATNDANPTELSTTLAKGVYLFDLTQAESNADLVVLSAASVTAGVEILPLLIYTEPEVRSADITKVDGDPTAATKLKTALGTEITGAAAAGTLSTTQMTTNLTETRDDQYNGRTLIFTSGVLTGVSTVIQDYNGTSKMLTFTGVATAPTAGDAFIIV